jgi:hypothetical protein
VISQNVLFAVTSNLVCRITRVEMKRFWLEHKHPLFTISDLIWWPWWSNLSFIILDTRIPEQFIPRKVFYRFFYFFHKIKLSITMTKHLSSVKEGLQSYCNKVYSRSSFNTMWILKYSYDLLDNFNSRFNTREVHVSKKLPQQFAHHSSWKCINTFKEISNAANYKRVTNATNL